MEEDAQDRFDTVSYFSVDCYIKKGAVAVQENSNKLLISSETNQTNHRDQPKVGTLVGVDTHGNEYYQNKDELFCKIISFLSGKSGSMVQDIVSHTSIEPSQIY